MGDSEVKIEYRNNKDLPCGELYKLFLAVGWAKEENTTQVMKDNFNCAFVDSTFVLSAWYDNHLVGCVRILSDLHFRSIIYDLAILPEYQKQGIGTELMKRCVNMCPNSEWLVQTDCAKGFYEIIGFKQNTKDTFLTLPSKWF